MKTKISINIITIFLFLFSTIAYTDGRIAVRGYNGAVASSSYTASQVGVEVLKKGGNAIDAAIATVTNV